MFQLLKFRKIKNLLKKFHFSLILLLRKVGDRYFYITFEKKIPKFHINDQYEKPVKWILRLILIISILTSVLAFQEWYLNLLLAIILLGLEQLLERSVFLYFSLYVTAIPEYKAEDWKGMMWVYTKDPTRKYFEVGIFFSSREAAKRIFPVIKHWSKSGNDDMDNMVQVSVIISNLDYYHVYIYPNFEKDPLYISIKEKRDKEHPEKEHKIKTLAIMLCKGFNYSSSTFPKFQALYKDGDPYYLCAYIVDNDIPIKLSELGYIKKYNLKIKSERDLNRKDPEYEHSSYVVDYDKYSEEEIEPSREYVVRASTRIF